jgi:DNA-binding NtrC family response regulator
LADVFERPLGGRRVAHAIERELGYESRQVRPMDPTDEDLYSHSPLMQHLMAIVVGASATRAGVLITGEEGTGRQVVARAIHSAPANGMGGTFVRVDFAAGDGDELERLLFGVVARTSAGPDDRGLERISCGSRLHEAAGGTLYLQNLTEAPARVQARLARVLRDREAVVSDNDTPIDLNVRPMAGVASTFDVAVHEGRVRADLFRRLSEIRIDMPPLHSRREDIPALANYFVRDVCAALGIPPKTLSRPALSLISALPWRGNAVELRALLESVVKSLQGGKGIGFDDVLAHVSLDGGASATDAGGTFRQARARFEREYIAATLERHHGRISDAAKALGVQRTNLTEK